MKKSGKCKKHCPLMKGRVCLGEKCGMIVGATWDDSKESFLCPFAITAVFNEEQKNNLFVRSVGKRG